MCRFRHGEEDLPPYEVLRKMFAAFGMKDMAAMRAEQLMRDAKVLQIYGGTDEIQISQIARSLVA